MAIAVLAGALLACPAGARAATVTAHASEPDPTGHGDDFPAYVDVTDVGHHRNDLELRVSARAVLVVERARRPLKVRHGCRRRGTRVAICRMADPTLYVDPGGGNDTVRGRCTSGDVSFYGGYGNDRLVSGGCAAYLYGGPGNDVLVGDSFGQWLYGGGGNDRLLGGGGQDTLYGDGAPHYRGSDFIDGGGGNDTVAWDERTDGIRADLRRGVAIGHGDRDILRRIESVAGTEGDDVLVGDGGPNRLLGSRGRDRLIGRGGNDVLDGGLQSVTYTDIADDLPDRFDCGPGRDRVRYPERSVLPVGCDRIYDFPGLFGETIRARPRAVGAHAVEVPVVCDITLTTCRRKVVVRDGRTVLGQSPLVDDPPAAIRVRLSRRARTNGAVTIVVTGDGKSADVFSEGELIPYRFSWRLACRGAPARDVCRIGGR
jgi:Ca2+-binding RTX toxin-like protein